MNEYIGLYSYMNDIIYWIYKQIIQLILKWKNTF